MAMPGGSDGEKRQPFFNIPPVVVALLAVMAVIHFVRVAILSDVQDYWVRGNFAFFPALPDGQLPLGEILPVSRAWSFLTYGLLHADWGHLLVNAFWMAAFGSPLAWRFGPVRFLLFSAAAVIAGALVHLFAYGGEEIPMVGASAAVSAHMAGAARFLFIGNERARGSYWAPAATLRAVVTDSRTMTFLGVWIAINIAIGVFGSAGVGEGRIAWEAHLGGFAVGLLMFRVFDPVPWNTSRPGPWNS